MSSSSEPMLSKLASSGAGCDSGVLTKPRTSSRKCRNSYNGVGVWVFDCNRLILVCKVPDHALGYYIEWLAHQDIICYVLNDVDLEIDSDVSNLERDIPSKSQG